MRNYWLLFIYAVSLAGCTSKPQEPESKKPTISQQEVRQEKENESESSQTISSEKSAGQYIVPGKSIGQIHLNEDAEVIQKILGRPTSANSAMGKSLQTWKLRTVDGKNYQLSIFFSRNMGNADEKSRAKQIRVTAPAYISNKQEEATTPVLRGNIQEAKKMLIYTLPGFEGQFQIYDNTNTGIAFEFDPPGNVIAITVHEPGKPAYEIFSEVSSDLIQIKPSEQTTLPFPGIKD